MKLEKECLIVDLITEPHGGRQIVEALSIIDICLGGDSMICTTIKQRNVNSQRGTPECGDLWLSDAQVSEQNNIGIKLRKIR